MVNIILIYLLSTFRSPCCGSCNWRGKCGLCGDLLQEVLHSSTSSVSFLCGKALVVSMTAACKGLGKIQSTYLINSCNCVVRWDAIIIMKDWRRWKRRKSRKKKGLREFWTQRQADRKCDSTLQIQQRGPNTKFQRNTWQLGSLDMTSYYSA